MIGIGIGMNSFCTHLGLMLCFAWAVHAQDPPLYGYGPSNGDSSLAKTNDFAQRLDLEKAFPFGGKNHSTLYISDNGVISFDGAVFVEPTENRYRNLPYYYDTDGDGEIEDPDSILPFWADTFIEGTNNGDVYYRVTDNNTATLDKATDDVRQHFRSNVDFTAQVVIVVTWHDVSFFEYASNPDTDPRNTFQAVLIHNGQESFVFFFYKQIDWVVGTLMGGSATTGTYSDTGLGIAVVGFLMDDGWNAYNMGYDQDVLLTLQNNSNVEIDGIYAYKVDSNMLIEPGTETTTGSPSSSDSPTTITLTTDQTLPGYGYGLSNGDSSLTKTNNIAQRLDLERAFPFGGKHHSTLYISDNGVISFDSAVYVEPTDTKLRNLPYYYDTDGDGEIEDPDSILPFWADTFIEGTNNGDVYYRVTENDTATLDKATDDVRQHFRSNVDFTAQVVIVVTWHEVSFYEYQSNADTDPRNTFQAVLIHDGQESFVFFIYKQIEWVVGTLMGGSATTGTYSETSLGIAVVGFLMDDGDRIYNMRYEQDVLLTLQNNSNVEIDGVYAYKVNSNMLFEPGTETTTGSPSSSDSPTTITLTTDQTLPVAAVILQCSATSMSVRVPLERLGGATAGSDLQLMNDGGCLGVISEDRMTIVISTNLTSCNNERSEDPNFEYYSNTVVEREYGVVTRVSDVYIPFTCYYNRTGRVGLRSYELKNYRLNVTEESSGQYDFALDIYRDGGFEKKYMEDDYPVDMEINEDLYFGASVPSQDNTLDLSITRCVATPSNSYNDDQYVFIEDGCSAGENTLIRPDLLDFVGVTMKTFRFVGLGNRVYIHCDLLVCDAKTGNLTECDVTCPRGLNARQRRHVTGSTLARTRISRGPIRFRRSSVDDEQKEWVSYGNKDSASTFNPWMLAIVTMAAVMIALLVVVAVVIKKMTSVIRSQHARKDDEASMPLMSE